MRMKAFQFTLILVLLGGLTACGKKGPLYLPDPPEKATPTHHDDA